MLSYQVSNVELSLQRSVTIKIVQALAIGEHSVTSLLLRKKHWSLVHVGSSMIFVAGRSQVLQTNYKRRVVVVHASQLLVELNAHRVLQRQPSRIETMQTYSSLCRTP